jgi:hypothetical protein
LGFTLLEIIVIIVLMGILVPALIMPIVQSSLGTSSPVEMTNLSGVARSELDTVIASLTDPLYVPGGTGTWPAALGNAPNNQITVTSTACSTGATFSAASAPAARCTITMAGTQYTSTITEYLYDQTIVSTAIGNGQSCPGATCPWTNTGANANNYILVTVNTVSPKGKNVSYQVVKVKNF